MTGIQIDGVVLKFIVNKASDSVRIKTAYANEQCVLLSLSSLSISGVHSKK